MGGVICSSRELDVRCEGHGRVEEDERGGGSCAAALDSDG